LRCHTISTFLDTRDDIYTKLTNKIGSKLKKNIDISVIDKRSYLEFMELIKKGGILHEFCRKICHHLGNTTQVTFDNILMKLGPKIKKKQKEYDEKVIGTPKYENGYIYVIRTRASVNIKEDVYKLGKTSRKFGMRMSGYDKGYEVILVVPIKQELLDKLEMNLLDQLELQFKKRCDYGNEYFEGSRLDIFKVIMENII
jgi:hypothetical protein